MIPKFIHQVWNEENVATYCDKGIGLQSQESLKRDYSDCKYKVWTHTEIEKIMRDDEFEYIKPIYDEVQLIKKADIGRLVILKKFGGMYFDLDIISHERIPHIFDDENIKFVGCGHHYKHGVHNAFIGCIKDHPLIDKTLLSISEETDLMLNPLDHTGPNRLTKVSRESGLYSEIHFLGLDEVGNKNQGPDKKYATHYRKHSW
tara:strand:- start:2557 stop:3165 length:609 start_codon:yes stop_codon:yes gene_type:complete